MKKLIAAVLIIAILAGGGYFAYTLYQKEQPENQIIGKWNGSNGLGFYNFNEDGTLDVGTAVLLDLSVKGTYTIDKEAMTLTVTYEMLGVSYNDTYSFTIDGNTLTLTGDTLGLVTTYYRDGAEIPTTVAEQTTAVSAA